MCTQNIFAYYTTYMQKSQGQNASDAKKLFNNTGLNGI